LLITHDLKLCHPMQTRLGLLRRLKNCTLPASKQKGTYSVRVSAEVKKMIDARLAKKFAALHSLGSGQTREWHRFDTFHGLQVLQDD
jgi:hypothetical protein